MELIGSVFLLAGFLVSLFYGISLLVRAFQTHILWGLGYIFIPFVSFIFVIVHWDRAKSPFLRGLIAIPLVIVGVILMPETNYGY